MTYLLDLLEPRRLMAAGDIDGTFARVAQSIVAPRTDVTDMKPVDAAIDSQGRSIFFGNATLNVSGRERQVMFLARFNAGGASDLTFANYGIQIIDLAAQQDAQDMVIDAADRVTVAFDASEADTVLVRMAQFSIDGVLNRRFGRSGAAFPRFGPATRTGDLAVDAANNLIVSANAANQIGVAKFSPTGRLTGDWGARGARFIPGTTGATARSMDISSSGLIYVGGTFPSAATGSDSGVVRIGASGAIDTTFAQNGVARVDIAGTRDVLDALLIDSYGRIVLSGRRGLTASETAPSNGSASPLDAVATMARLTVDGAMDNRFYRRGRLSANQLQTNEGDGKFYNYISNDDAPVVVAEHAGRYLLGLWDAMAPVTFSGRAAELFYIQEQSGFQGNFGLSGSFDAGGSIPAIATRDTHYAAALSLTVYSTSGYSRNDDRMHVGIRTETDANVLLAFEDSDATVLANGRLILGNTQQERTEYFNYLASGKRDLSFGSAGSLINFDESDRTNELFGLYPLQDGAFYATYSNDDMIDRDSGAMMLQHIRGDGTQIQTVSQPPDENHLTAVDLLPRSYFAYTVVESMGNSRQSSLVAPTGEEVATANPNYDSGEPRFIAPLLGSTDFFVTFAEAGDYDTTIGNYIYTYRVVRYNADLSLDTTFGGDGVVDNLHAKPLLGQASGKLLYTIPGVAGLRRLNADGTADNTFGTGGGVMGGDFDHYDVDSKGRIVAWRVLKGGAADGDIQIARFSQNGKVDTTFGGGDGIMIVDARLPSTATPNVIIDTQDRLVVTAYRQSATAISWSATRILGD